MKNHSDPTESCHEAECLCNRPFYDAIQRRKAEERIDDVPRDEADENGKARDWHEEDMSDDGRSIRRHP